ncbi:MAG TPA: ABC transporter substrate-binding protein, partial [Kofleriaceae bacterium]|nr:ABC transporter substrate-binding protein [Kofleriaceae bacterium]
MIPEALRRIRVAFVLATAAALTLVAPASVAADMNKVIRHVFPAGEEGFDPAAAHDLYSGTVMQVIFETLLTYDYLARPSKLVPLTAEALPTITDNGQTYTLKIKKGIHFTPDPAFKGVKRELVADDYIYSFKRLMDPAIHSPWTWLLEGKIVGLDELADKAKKEGKFDYGARVAGLEAVDRYTLRIRLKQPDYNLSYVLAHEPTSAVAHEVVAAYGDSGGRTMSNPVGTGPYKLAKWIRSSKIYLEANPDFRGFTWDFKAGSDPDDARIIAEMKGKKMPQIGRVEISIMEEDQSRLLAFQNGELDLMNMEGPLAPKVLDGGKLTPDMQKRGVKLS